MAIELLKPIDICFDKIFFLFKLNLFFKIIIVICNIIAFFIRKYHTSEIFLDLRHCKYPKNINIFNHFLKN